MERAVDRHVYNGRSRTNEEVFGDETCGLITENNMESLEAGIRKMLTDEEFYRQAKAGAERRSAYFDGKRMVKEVENMFLNLVGEQ